MGMLFLWGAVFSILSELFKTLMDILYTLKACNVCEELTYSLRSLANLPHDKICFVGGFPNNIQRADIVYIPTIQKSTKWKNSTENLKIACQDHRLSEEFILMNDDFFILKPIREVVKDLSLNQGLVKDVYKRYCDKGLGQTAYVKGMKETEKFLNDLGISNPLSFELHIPMIFNKKDFLSMFNLPNIGKISVLHWRTIYGNFFCKNTEYHPDVKVSLKTPLNVDAKFLSSSDAAWNKVKPFLEQFFPKKSLYEF